MRSRRSVMAVGAFAIIRQQFDDATIGDMAVIASFDHQFQLCL